MLFETILKYEQSLLDQETRTDPKRLDKILADDFLEFSSSGLKLTKQDVISWLVKEESFNHKISDFKVQHLAKEVVLATYSIKMFDSESLRSSIWILEEGSWQLKFHQGTSTGKRS